MSDEIEHKPYTRNLAHPQTHFQSVIEGERRLRAITEARCTKNDTHVGNTKGMSHIDEARQAFRKMNSGQG